MYPCWEGFLFQLWPCYSLSLPFKQNTGRTFFLPYNLHFLVIISCWSEVLGYLVMSDCDPVDCSPPGSSVLGILQARILEWIAIPVSRGSSQLRDRTQVSCIVGRFFTVWTTEKSLFAIKLFLKFFLLHKAILDWLPLCIPGAVATSAPIMLHAFCLSSHSQNVLVLDRQMYCFFGFRFC